MARAYSLDLRERVIAAAGDGVSARAAAGHFGVGVSTAIVWVRRWRESGETAARRQGQPRRSKLDAHADFLLNLVATQSDITLEEMRDALDRERGVSTGIVTVWRFFAARGLTFKKNGARARTGTGRRGCGAGGVAKSSANDRP